MPTPSPIPRLPPVTITLRTLTHQLARPRDGQLLSKRDRGRHLVAGEGIVTKLQNFLLQRPSPSILGRRLQDDFRDNEGTGNRALSGPHQRHTHLRVAIDDGFNLFGMHFQPPDVDHTISPADKIVAIAALFDHISGIDKTVRVLQYAVRLADVADGRSRRPDA